MQRLGIGLSVARGRLVPRLWRPAPLPLGRLLRGRPPEEVAEMLPRLFNLCGAAQGLAAYLALGLPVDAAPATQEVIRDHLAKLCLQWPAHLGLAPRALPQGWQRGEGIAACLWGEALGPDGALAAMSAWLHSGQGIAPLVLALDAAFAKGEACAQVAPLTAPLDSVAQENSPAARVADHPLMAWAEARRGRGPLWRALGRAVDLSRLVERDLPYVCHADGMACVGAARGTYALKIEQENGRVTDVVRVTPTDHMMAPDGVLERSLASLPPSNQHLAGLVIDLIDPCLPVQLTDQTTEAEYA